MKSHCLALSVALVSACAGQTTSTVHESKPTPLARPVIELVAGGTASTSAPNGVIVATARLLNPTHVAPVLLGGNNVSPCWFEITLEDGSELFHTNKYAGAGAPPMNASNWEFAPQTAPAQLDQLTFDVANHLLVSRHEVWEVTENLPLRVHARFFYQTPHTIADVIKQETGRTIFDGKFDSKTIELTLRAN